MPGFQDAQEKNRSNAAIATFDSPTRATDIVPFVCPAEPYICLNFAHGRQCAHDLRMTRIYSVLAAALVLLLGAGNPGGRSQPAPSPLELRQIADGVFVHVGAMAMMNR